MTRSGKKINFSRQGILRGVLGFLTVLLVSVSFVNPIDASYPRATSSTTWNFQNSSDFTISDSTKVKFSNNSVKIIPTGAVSNGYQALYDNEWGETASIWANAVATDSNGNIYFAGNVNQDAVASPYNFYAFIEKMDPDFNVIWNKKYFLSPGYSTALKGGFNDIELSEDGYLYGLTVGTTVVAGVATSATASLVKIDSSNGDLVWQKDRPKPVWAGKTPWADTWDEGSGPRIDSEGNIYISYSVGCGRNRNNGQQIVSGPIAIVKYDPDGNELWSVVDDVIEGRTLCFTHPAYEDSWEMVVDSENSVYVDSSYWITTATNNMGYATAKYDKDGNFKWRDIKDYTGDWDSPRSLSIDNNDYIYVNGNPPISQGLSCTLRKLDKDGNVIINGQNLNPTGTADDFSYCWGAAVDDFDRWVSVGNNVGKLSMAYYGKSGESAMVLESSINYDLTMMTGTQGLHKITFDKFGNVYSIMPRFINGSGREQTAILKSKNTYPDTMPATGTPITLVNKTGLDYEYLTGFAIDYGEADQNDAGFQISNNGTNWYYWNGSSWTQTAGNDYSSASTINSNIASFSTQLGSGTFYFKTFMLTDGTKQVDLASVTITEGPIPTPIPTSIATSSTTTTPTIGILPETGVDKYLFWAMDLI